MADPAIVPTQAWCDLYLNPSLPPNAKILVLPTTQITLLASIQGFRTHSPLFLPTSFFLHLPAIPKSIGVLIAFASVASQSALPSSGFILSDVHLGGTLAPATFFALFGAKELLLAALGKLGAPLNSAQHHKTADWTWVLDHLTQPQTFYAIEKSETVFYLVTDQQLVWILRSQNVSISTKVVTTYYLCFPQTREYISGAFTMMPIPPTLDLVVKPGCPSSEDVLASLAVGILGAAYSQPSTIARQIKNRAAAALEGSDYTAPSEMSINSIITLGAWEPSKRRGEIWPVLGHAFAYNKRKQFDVYVTTGDLWADKDVCAHFDLEPEVRDLYAQARMVYQWTQMTSLRFGFTALPLVAKYFVALAGTWEAERVAATKIMKKLENSPFAGLQHPIPSEQTVKRQARIVYVGLLYHRDTLNTPDEGASYEKYAVEAISNQVATLHDRSTCSVLAGLLPGVAVGVLAAMAKTLDPGALEDLVSKKDDQFKEDLYRHLNSEGSTAPWFKHEEKRRAAMQRGVWLDQAIALANSRFAKTRGQLAQASISAKTDKERAEAAARTATIEIAFHTALSKLETMDSLLAPASSMSDVQARDAILAECASLFTIAGGAVSI